MIHDKKITFVPPPTMANKVAAIKAIRTITGLGLKEAKDACEMAGKRQHYGYAAGLTQASLEENSRILRGEGFEVGASVFLILEELRKLGSQALLQGEDELANEILQLVLAEKLRRKPELLG